MFFLFHHKQLDHKKKRLGTAKLGNSGAITISFCKGVIWPFSIAQGIAEMKWVPAEATEMVSLLRREHREAHPGDASVRSLQEPSCHQETGKKL